MTCTYRRSDAEVTATRRQYFMIQDNIKETLFNDLIREDGGKAQAIDVLNNQTQHDSSFSFPEILGHENHLEEVHTYAAKLVPNRFYMDEFISTKCSSQEFQVGMNKMGASHKDRGSQSLLNQL